MTPEERAKLDEFDDVLDKNLAAALNKSVMEEHERRKQEEEAAEKNKQAPPQVKD